MDILTVSRANFVNGYFVAGFWSIIFYHLGFWTVCYVVIVAKHLVELHDNCSSQNNLLKFVLTLCVSICVLQLDLYHLSAISNGHRINECSALVTTDLCISFWTHN